MASKGQKYKKYTRELKELILKEYYEDYKRHSFLKKNMGCPVKRLAIGFLKQNTVKMYQSTIERKTLEDKKKIIYH